jgi:hypothetical protein
MDDYRVSFITAYDDECELRRLEGFRASSPLHLQSRASDSHLRSISLNSLFSTGLVLCWENLPASVARR